MNYFIDFNLKYVKTNFQKHISCSVRLHNTLLYLVLG